MKDGDIDGRERGTAMHLMLQTLTTQELSEPDTLPPAMASAIGREPDDPEGQAWWQEALQTWRNPDFSFMFERPQFDRAFNEVPVQYLDGDVMVYGIIDRLVLSAGKACVIDLQDTPFCEYRNTTRTRRTLPGADAPVCQGNCKSLARDGGQAIPVVYRLPGAGCDG